MDLAWIATCVTAVAGLGGTLYVSREAGRREERRAAEQRVIDQERASDDARRDALDGQRPAVMRLSKAFIRARQAAQLNPETFEGGPDMFSELFPESWQETYYASMEDAELISDPALRTVILDCLQSIQWSGGLENQFGWGSARRIVSHSGALGFRATGSWLRGEPLNEELLKAAAGISELLRAYDEYWESQSDPSKVGERPDLLESPRSVAQQLSTEQTLE